MSLPERIIPICSFVFYLALEHHALCAPGKHSVRPSRHMRYMAPGLRANGSECSLSVIE